MDSKITKTLVCVGIAGSLFIASVICNIKPLFLIGAFFDWLPLPAGWMRLDASSKSGTVKKTGIIHGVITLIAYALGIA